MPWVLAQFGAEEISDSERMVGVQSAWVAGVRGIVVHPGNSKSHATQKAGNGGIRPRATLALKGQRRFGNPRRLLRTLLLPVDRSADQGWSVPWPIRWISAPMDTQAKEVSHHGHPRHPLYPAVWTSVGRPVNVRQRSLGHLLLDSLDALTSRAGWLSSKAIPNWPRLDVQRTFARTSVGIVPVVAFVATT